LEVRGDGLDAGAVDVDEGGGFGAGGDGGDGGGAAGKVRMDFEDMLSVLTPRAVSVGVDMEEKTRVIVPLLGTA
jgi:hypothetical protein